MTKELTKVCNRATPGSIVLTADGSFTLAHKEHGQSYHSSEGAMFEARELYIVGSGFQNALTSNRFENISILDVGMGLGYNSSAAVVCWLESSGVSSLEILSLEIDTSLAAEFISGHARWCANWSEQWLFGVKEMKQVSGGSYVAKVQHPAGRGELTWRVDIGDASQLLWRGAEKFDFIWQDPFTPDLNPSLWSAAWFRTLRDGCHEGAVLMTYSASRVVKDALCAAGWTVNRIKTPGKKRHWLKATNWLSV